MSTPLPPETRKRTPLKHTETAPRKRIRLDVQLPEGIQPYPSQTDMMVRILEALDGGYNVVAESPTGSGKTLAMLASTSAWLISHREKEAIARAACDVHGTEAKAAKAQTQCVVEAKPPLSPAAETGVSSYEVNVVDPGDGHTATGSPSISGSSNFKLEEDFSPYPASSKNELPNTLSFELPVLTSVVVETSPSLACICLPNVKIYYATRTHHLIDQLVKEFGRLPYAKILNHTIGASRERLNANTDVVFCTFNYLIDPIIRNSADVTLENSIVILDEAANIEDVCLQAASFTFDEEKLAAALNSFIGSERDVHTRLAEFSTRKVFNPDDENWSASMAKLSSAYSVIVAFMKDLWSWFVDVAKSMTNCVPGMFTKKVTSNGAYDSRTDSMLLTCLLTPNGSPEYERLKSAFQTLVATTILVRPDRRAMVVVEKWLYVQQYFSEKFTRSTYTMHVVTERRLFDAKYESDRGQGSMSPAYNAAGSILMDSHKIDGVLPDEGDCTTSVSLWCMTPSIAFTGAFNGVRSVILASTLSQNDSLISELGMQFKMQTEDDQVLWKYPEERCLAAVLPVGPSGLPLTINYTNMQRHSDTLIQVAEVVENICATVPQGVLCFVSCYRVLDLLTSYMRDNEMYLRIGKMKVIMEEPRNANDLNSMMKRFDDVISNPQNYGSHINGVLMFAVFRGKISDGIDFADGKARAVISIGIPYASLYEPEVQAKRSYNGGNVWYSAQAYRAMNQALGRCLRHRNDWGALVLVDERLADEAEGVSQWIREQLVVYPDYGSFDKALNRFVHTMTAQQAKPCE